MKIHRVKITPDVAREMLRGNTRNRPVRQSHVDFLASEMVNGRWVDTAETISRATDGTIVDGQHRLLAVIQSGVTLDLWVADDVPIQAQDVVDMGAQRSIADQLHLSDGVANANVVVGACRSIVSICCFYQNYKLSVAQARQVYSDFHSEIDCAIESCRGHRPAARAWVYGTLAFLLKASPRLVEFVNRIGDGAGIAPPEPAYEVREWLSKDSVNLRTNYKRYAVECMANAAFAELAETGVRKLRSGRNGIEFFVQKNRRYVESIRKAMAQQMDT